MHSWLRTPLERHRLRRSAYFLSQNAVFLTCDVWLHIFFQLIGSSQQQSRGLKQGRVSWKCYSQKWVAKFSHHNRQVSSEITCTLLGLSFERVYYTKLLFSCYAGILWQWNLSTRWCGWTCMLSVMHLGRLLSLGLAKMEEKREEILERGFCLCSVSVRMNRLLDIIVIIRIKMPPVRRWESALVFDMSH